MTPWTTCSDMPSSAPRLLRRFSAWVLSTWFLSGLTMLGAAWVADQVLGGTTTLPGARPDPIAIEPGSLVYLARLGLSPVVSAVGLALALWLLHHERRRAAAAVATASFVVIAFSARPFAAVDLIGWRQAFLESAIAGRTIATTAMATVLGAVFYYERLLSRPAVALIVLGFPLVIGMSRITLGVYPIPIVARQWAIGALIGGGMVTVYLLAGAKPNASEP